MGNAIIKAYYDTLEFFGCQVYRPPDEEEIQSVIDKYYRDYLDRSYHTPITRPIGSEIGALGTPYKSPEEVYQELYNGPYMSTPIGRGISDPIEIR